MKTYGDKVFVVHFITRSGRMDLVHNPYTSDYCKVTNVDPDDVTLIDTPADVWQVHPLHILFTKIEEPLNFFPE